MIPLNYPKLFNREQAAEYIGIKPHTLDVWASSGRYNLKYIKVGRLVRYRQEHLDEFLAERTTTSAQKDS